MTQRMSDNTLLAVTLLIVAVMVTAWTADAAVTVAESGVGVIDTVLPRVTGVVVNSPRQAAVTYSKDMNVASATLSVNYAISGDKGNLSVNPTGVSGALRNFTLTWGAGEMFNGGQIAITVSNVRDALGNPVSPIHNSGGDASQGSYPTGNISIEDGGTGVVAGRNVTLSVSATDQHSAVTKMRFSNDNVSWSPVTFADYSTSYSWTLAEGANGLRTVYAQFRDAAGNVSTQTISASVTLLATNPTVTVSGETSATNTARTVTITFSENVTGFASGAVTVQNGVSSNFTQVSASVYTVSVQGNPGAHDVTISVPQGAAVNGGGNISLASNEFSFYYDSLAPTGAVAITPTFQPDFVNTIHVMLALDASDEGVGVSSMRFSNNAVTWSDWVDYAVTHAWSLAGGVDGLRTVYVQFRDGVGNVSDNATDAVTLDTARPQPTVAGDTTPTSQPRTVAITFGEAVFDFVVSDLIVENGTASNLQVIDAGQYTADIQGADEGTVRVRLPEGAALDRAGNLSLATVTSFEYEFVDVRPPAPVLTALPVFSPGTSRLVECVPDASLLGTTMIYVTECWDAVPDSPGAVLRDTDTRTTGDIFTRLFEGLAHGGAYYYRSKVRRIGPIADNPWSAWSDVVQSTQDAQAPTGTLSLPGRVNTLDVTLEVAGEALSGIERMRFSNDSIFWAEWVPFAAAGSWTLAAGAEGARTVYAQLESGVGTVSTAEIKVSAVYDITRPTTSVTGPSGTASAAVTVTITFSEVVHNFTSGGVVVTNGSASNLRPAAPAQSFQVDVLGAGIGDVTVFVPAGAARDEAGNDNVESAPFVFMFNDGGVPVPVLESIPPHTAGSSRTIRWQPGSGSHLFTLQYSVECYTDAGLQNLFVWSPPLGDAIREYTFTGLQHGQTYWYRARARAGGDWSNWSAVVFSRQDSQPPVFSNVRVTPGLAAPGDVVTIAFDVSETLSEAPLVSVNGNYAVEIPGKGSGYLFVYEVSAADPLGAAEILISGNDLAGNLGFISVTTQLTLVAAIHSVPLRAWPIALVLLMAGSIGFVRRRRA